MAKKILVIEDERTTRTSIVNFLESEGFNAVMAENGRAGIQMAQEHLPDLIICDILMPELDGYDVLTTLQQDTKTASIPFIFLTMAATEAGLQQSMNMGADDYLSKPITSERLRQAIALQLQKQPNSQPRAVETAGLASKSASAWTFADERTSTQARSAQRLSTETALLEVEQVPEFQQLLQAKDRLFQQLSQGVRQQVIQMLRTMQHLKQKPIERDIDRQLNELQEASARVLVLVNEVTALHNVLTPENTKTLLEQFNLAEEADRSFSRE